MNNCRDWAFSSNGLELPAFQLPTFAKCDALPALPNGDLFAMFVKVIHSRCSFLEFQASTPYQKLEAPESGSTLHHVCIMIASFPSLCCSCRKSLSYAEKQRVWSRSCGFQDLLLSYNAVIVRALSYAMSMWRLETNEQLSRLSFEQQWVGSVAANLSVADVGKMWRIAQWRFVQQVCLRNLFPLFLLEFQASTPYQKLVLWLHHPMQRSRGFGHGVVVSKICLK